MISLLRLPYGVLFWVVVLVFMEVDVGAMNIFSEFPDFGFS